MEIHDAAGGRVPLRPVQQGMNDPLRSTPLPIDVVRRRQRGFTLVEVSIASVLLVIGLLALAHVALTIRSMQRADEERALATGALLDELRSIETTRFSDLTATFDGVGFDVTLPGAATPALRPLPGDPDGRVGLVTIDAPDPPKDATELLEANVSLDWDGAFGPQHLSRRIRISRAGSNPGASP
jgi:prepilin-type N-terminal cleavage/methylation domain-containing protein